MAMFGSRIMATRVSCIMATRGPGGGARRTAASSSRVCYSYASAMPCPASPSPTSSSSGYLRARPCAALTVRTTRAERCAVLASRLAPPCALLCLLFA
eukprot:1797297-Rhodomonas_salina.2